MPDNEYQLLNPYRTYQSPFHLLFNNCIQLLKKKLPIQTFIPSTKSLFHSSYSVVLKGMWITWESPSKFEAIVKSSHKEVVTFALPCWSIDHRELVKTSHTCMSSGNVNWQIDCHKRVWLRHNFSINVHFTYVVSKANGSLVVRFRAVPSKLIPNHLVIIWFKLL